MIKKTFCIILALAFALCVCACAKRGDNGPGVTAEPTAAQTSEPTPVPGDTNSTKPADDKTATALDGVAPGTVLIAFMGIKEAQITAEQIKALDLYDYTETMADETPVFSGPLVRDVLELAGAQDAAVIKAILGGGASERSFEVAKLDPETAVFAVLKDGEVMGEGLCTLICTDTDGFSYMLDIDAPLVLE